MLYYACVEIERLVVMNFLMNFFVYIKSFFVSEKKEENNVEEEANANRIEQQNNVELSEDNGNNVERDDSNQAKEGKKKYQMSLVLYFYNVVTSWFAYYFSSINEKQQNEKCKEKNKLERRESDARSNLNAVIESDANQENNVVNRSIEIEDDLNEFAADIERMELVCNNSNDEDNLNDENLNNENEVIKDIDKVTLGNEKILKDISDYLTIKNNERVALIKAKINEDNKFYRKSRKDFLGSSNKNKVEKKLVLVRDYKYRDKNFLLKRNSVFDSYLEEGLENQERNSNEEHEEKFNEDDEIIVVNEKKEKYRMSISKAATNEMLKESVKIMKKRFFNSMVKNIDFKLSTTNGDLDFSAFFERIKNRNKFTYDNDVENFLRKNKIFLYDRRDLNVNDHYIKVNLLTQLGYLTEKRFKIKYIPSSTAFVIYDKNQNDEGKRSLAKKFVFRILYNKRYGLDIFGSNEEIELDLDGSAIQNRNFVFDDFEFMAPEIRNSIDFFILRDVNNGDIIIDDIGMNKMTDKILRDNAANNKKGLATTKKHLVFQINCYN